MALVIENGTGVAGATSYVTLVEARAYATARGVTLPSDADTTILVTKALDYLESLRDSYKGTKEYGAGYLQWPRTDVEIDGFAVGIDAIPAELKNAQCQLAMEFYASVDPLATTSSAAIKSEKVGPLETVYALSDGERPGVVMPKVDALLAPLLKEVGFGLSTLRV